MRTAVNFLQLVKNGSLSEVNSYIKAHTKPNNYKTLANLTTVKENNYNAMELAEQRFNLNKDNESYEIIKSLLNINAKRQNESAPLLEDLEKSKNLSQRKSQQNDQDNDDDFDVEAGDDIDLPEKIDGEESDNEDDDFAPTKKDLPILSFNINGTALNNVLNPEKINPYLLPLFYFSHTQAKENNFSFGFFFHRQKDEPVTLDPKFLTEEIQHHLNQKPDQKHVFASHEISTPKKDEPDSTSNKVKNIQSAIHQLIGKKKNISFKILHIDNDNLKENKINEDNYTVSFYHFNGNDNKLNNNDYGHYVKGNESALHTAADHIGLFTYANNLLNSKDPDPFKSSYLNLKDLAAIHYLLLTRDPTDQIEDLLNKFLGKYKLNDYQRESFLQALSIYDGIAKYANDLLNSTDIIFTKGVKDFSAIIYLLKNVSSQHLDSIKKVILKFAEVKLSKLNKENTNNFWLYARKRFDESTIQEIQKIAVSESYNSLLKKIKDCHNNPVLDNIHTLVTLYKFYDKGFNYLGEEEKNILFNNHLTLILQIHIKEKLDDYFLLDFAKRVYPYLKSDQKEEFLKFLSNLKGDIKTKIGKMLDQPWEKRTGMCNRLFSPPSDEKKRIYSEKSLEGCGDVIQSNALQIAGILELKTAREEAKKPVDEKTGSVQNKQIVDAKETTLSNILKGFDSNKGPSHIKNLLDTSYSIKDENKTTKITGWDLFRENFSENENEDAVPFIEKLLQKAKDPEFSSNAAAQFSATYIEKVAIPEVLYISPTLKALILDSQYWATKCLISIPDGIKELQDLIKSKDKNGEEITLREFKSKVDKRLQKPTGGFLTGSGIPIRKPFIKQYRRLIRGENYQALIQNFRKFWEIKISLINKVTYPRQVILLDLNK